MTDTNLQQPTPDNTATLPADQQPQPNVDAAIAGEEAQAAQEAAAKQASNEALSYDDLLNLSPDDLEKLLGENAPGALQEVQAPDAGAGDTQPPLDEEDDEVTVDDKGQSIPRSRLNDEIRKRKKLEEELSTLREERAYLAGKASATTVASQPADEKAPLKVAYNNVTQQLAGLSKEFQTAKDDLARKFDEGEIDSMRAYEAERDRLNAEFKQRQNTLVTKRHELTTLLTQPSPEQLEQRIAGDPQLQDATDRLIADNPWIEQIPDAAFTALQDQAYKMLTAAGESITPDPAGTWKLRAAIAVLGKQWGLDKAYPAPQGAPPVTTAQPGQRAMNGVTAEQRAQKLALAAQHPPAAHLAGRSTLANSEPIQMENATSFQISDKISTKDIEAELIKAGQL